MRPTLALAFVTACTSSTTAPTMEAVGKFAFEDKNLSQPSGQACADCHAANVAFRDPESDYSTSAGAIPTRFGPRNAPTAMYARYIPPLHVEAGSYVGGLFWDGRADTLEDQAKGPLLNPLEMDNSDAASVQTTLRAASYAGDFHAMFGAAALDDPDTALEHLAEAIAAYERSDELSPFSSKYDRYVAGKATLTDAEQRGLAIFSDPARGNCASCHPPPLFTDFSYANLGIPKYGNSKYLVQPPELNPDGAAFIDHGLMKTTGDPAQDGKFRAPTLRNIARTPPYGHNGYFENLPYILSFIATRDTAAWDPPEVAANVDARVGKLPLSPQDLDDLAAFLNTLSDE